MSQRTIGESQQTETEAEDRPDDPDDTPAQKAERLQDLAEQVQTLSAELTAVQEEVENDVEQGAVDVADTLRGTLQMESLDREYIEAFAERPYCILPKSEDEAYVVAPRFVDFHVGWLDRQTESYNVYVVNKYVDWIDELPADIRDEVGIEAAYEEATVEDGHLHLADEDERERAWDDLGGTDGGLYQRAGDDRIKLKNGAEFDVIAELIERGNLPFSPSPVDEADLRGEPDGVTLRSYQQRAWERFVETGMVGVYWPPGAGKTYLSLYAGERVAGDTLVVVPSSTLEAQWEDRIEQACGHADEFEVRTYQYLTHGDNMQDYTGADGPALTVFDECHRLPANTFGKLATIDTDYRIGLSASPYREDGRTEYIFALTGYPVGLEWEELVSIGAVQMPEAQVYLYRTARQKREDVATVVREQPGKVVVFCDGLDAGEALADRLDAPFVSGETPKGERMEQFRENRVVISSRVGDEGVSLPDLDCVIEYDFHGGSRRQEAQRYGRVMHGEAGEGTHIILMTDDEREQHGKRLYGLEEQGVDVRYERRE